MADGEAILNPFPMVNMAAIGGFLFPWLMRAATLVLHHPFDLPIYLRQLEEEKIAYTNRAAGDPESAAEQARAA